MKLTDADGDILVRLARKAVEGYVGSGSEIAVPQEMASRFQEKRGCFVTLYQQRNEERRLRGCIGFVSSDSPLASTVVEAAIAAATEDPRFPRVTIGELPSLIYEVSVLSEPELVRVSSPKDYPSKITVGKDGLIVKWRFGSGLLLPQVAVEYGWDAEEFLAQACMKAGGTPDVWLLPDTKIYTFQATVFSEQGPHTPSVHRKMG